MAKKLRPIKLYSFGTRVCFGDDKTLCGEIMGYEIYKHCTYYQIVHWKENERITYSLTEDEVYPIGDYVQTNIGFKTGD